MTKLAEFPPKMKFERMAEFELGLSTPSVLYQYVYQLAKLKICFRSNHQNQRYTMWLTFSCPAWSSPFPLPPPPPPRGPSRFPRRRCRPGGGRGQGADLSCPFCPLLGAPPAPAPGHSPLSPAAAVACCRGRRRRRRPRHRRRRRKRRNLRDKHYWYIQGFSSRWETCVGRNSKFTQLIVHKIRYCGRCSVLRLLTFRIFDWR